MLSHHSHPSYPPSTSNPDHNSCHFHEHYNHRRPPLFHPHWINGFEVNLWGQKRGADITRDQLGLVVVQVEAWSHPLGNENEWQVFPSRRRMTLCLRHFLLGVNGHWFIDDVENANLGCTIYWTICLLNLFDVLRCVSPWSTCLQVWTWTQHGGSIRGENNMVGVSDGNVLGEDEGYCSSGQWWW